MPSQGRMIESTHYSFKNILYPHYISGAIRSTQLMIARYANVDSIYSIQSHCCHIFTLLICNALCMPSPQVGNHLSFACQKSYMARGEASTQGLLSILSGK